MNLNRPSLWNVDKTKYVYINQESQINEGKII